MKHSLLLSLVLAVASTSPAQAEEGADLIALGQSKAAACAGCHGLDGNSAAPIYPKLAGQHASYLKKQLQEFKTAASGQPGRAAPMMAPMALPLSDSDMDALAAFYASQKTTPLAATDEVASQGQALYMGGDPARGVAACAACHGPQGAGMEQAKFPRVSGQHPAYLRAQLQMFRDGTRSNDPSRIMRDISQALTDREIELLANYMAGLH
ncbi:MAG: c-type cytochrome [Aeromonas sp.]